MLLNIFTDIVSYCHSVGDGMDSIVSPWESIFSTKRCWLLDSLVTIFSGDGKKLIGLLVIASSIFRYWNITRTRELIVLFNVRQITANSYCVICVYLASLFQKGLSETVLTSVLHRINWSHSVINQLKTVSEAEKRPLTLSEKIKKKLKNFKWIHIQPKI